jgi:hypothetical protein
VEASLLLVGTRKVLVLILMLLIAKASESDIILIVILDLINLVCMV